MVISAIKIETRMAELGLTKRALANNCGVSRHSVSAIIRRGSCEPRTAGKLAAGLGVPVSAIIAEEGCNK